MYEIDDERFWESYANNDYLDIFYIRMKVWRGLIKARPPVDSRFQAFNEPNLHPQNKNMLYFNIPFCASRCSYCLYYTKMYDKALVDEYLKSLEKEIKSIKDSEYIKSTKFECVYFGGGTPSLLQEDQIDKIAKILYENFKFKDDVEISFEVNPSSVTENKMAALKRNNFNRVSLGIQSFNDKYLKQMNCKHNSIQAKDITKRFLDEGFTVNADLIFGFEGQTEDELQSDLQEILNLKSLHHISIFPLRIVTETPLYNELEKNKALDLNMHNQKLVNHTGLINRFLKENGYVREEESVLYYKKGFRPHRYQSLDGRIVGIGAGAGTLLDNVESGNIFDVNEYIECINSGKSPAFADSSLTDEQTYERYILYRLLFMDRSIDNTKDIISKRFKEFYGIDIEERYEKVIGHLSRKKLITVNNNRVVLTARFNNVLKNFRFGTPSII